MQASATAQGVWERTRKGSKAGFDKLWGWADKLATPANQLSNKLGSEAFWPMSLGKECDKAARILRSFCKDGFYEEASPAPGDGPTKKPKVLKKIPSEVIRDAKGLAIFTTMRAGFWVSGAGGSGILIGRLPDGTWSAPSGILLHTAGFGFLVGADIYDCIIVLNTQEALEAFSNPRFTLGGELSAVAGPVGVGGVLESEVHKRQAPVFTYLKSRGFYAGIQIDGTVIIERSDENERFYHDRFPASDIVAGKVPSPADETKTLMETIKAAQGDKVDEALLPEGPSLGDIDHNEKDEDGHVFGVPKADESDPYGYLALEKEGIPIVEAATKRRPSSFDFEFRPSVTSPVYSTFHRSSVDSRASISRRSSWRTSTVSLHERAPMVDMATQTDFEPPYSPSPWPSPSPWHNHSHSPWHSPSPRQSTFSNVSHMNGIPENKSTDEDTKPISEESETNEMNDAKIEMVDEEKDEHEEEPVIIQTVQQTAAPQVISRAKLVTVAKRPNPPALPPRNPIRDRKKPLIITGDNNYRTDDDDTDHATMASMSPISTSPSHNEKRPVSPDEAKTPTSPGSPDSMSSVDHLDAIRNSFSKARIDEECHAITSDERVTPVPTQEASGANEQKTGEPMDHVSSTETPLARRSPSPHATNSPRMPGALP